MQSNKLTQFIKGGLGGAFDAAVSSFPPTAVVWGAIKGGISATRTKRAEDFIICIEQNLTLEQFQDEQIIDGVSLSFEQFIKQRSEEKRKIIKEIFTDFTKSANKEGFELERLYRTTELISLDAIKFISFIYKEVWSDILTTYKTGDKRAKLSEKLGDFFEKHNQNTFDFYRQSYQEYVSELINLGILSTDGYKIVTRYNESRIEFVVTDFGINFIRYLTQL